MTGFLNIWKGEGIPSTKIVNRLKRLTGTPCGHMGTLDPLAEGVLPVGVGNAARLFDYFLEKQKTYTARFRFGATTETLDREGEVECGGRIPAEEEIAAALPAFVGEISQVPPLYSAKNVNGRKSYRLARLGKAPELPPKQVKVFSFVLTGQTAPDEFAFRIECGAGTYIRALARDLGGVLSTKAYMTALRRERSGPFTQETAVPIEELTPDNIAEFLIPTDMVLPFPAAEVTDLRFFNGVHVPFGGEDGRYKIYRGGAFYGLGIAEGGVLRPDKKLC